MLHSDTYSTDGVPHEERLVMIRLRKLARTIVRNSIDLQDDSGNSGGMLIRGHAVYMARMLLDALDACVCKGFTLLVPLDSIKSQLDGCFGVGWRTGVESQGHSFIRQFTLKGTSRMVPVRSGK